MGQQQRDRPHPYADTAQGPQLDRVSELVLGVAGRTAEALNELAERRAEDEARIEQLNATVEAAGAANAELHAELSRLEDELWSALARFDGLVENSTECGV